MTGAMFVYLLFMVTKFRNACIGYFPFCNNKIFMNIWLVFLTTNMIGQISSG